MRAAPLLAMMAYLALLGCAGRPDRFYTLTPVSDSGRADAAAPPTIHVALDVTVPSLDDRGEIVLRSAQNDVVILDHERWAAPLQDQAASALARDIEAQRADVLVGDQRFGQPGATVAMKVDIVQMSAARSGRVRLDTRWRIVDKSDGSDRLGSAAFEASFSSGDYASMAAAYSRTLGELAARLASAIRAR